MLTISYEIKLLNEAEFKATSSSTFKKRTHLISESHNIQEIHIGKDLF